MAYRLTIALLVLLLAAMLAAIPASARGKRHRASPSSSGWTQTLHADGALDLVVPAWVALR